MNIFFHGTSAFDAHTHTHTQTGGYTALVRYGPTNTVVGSSLSAAVGVRNISIVHAQCSLSGNQLLPMATANGVAPSHNVTLLLSTNARAVDLILFYYYYCDYLSPGDEIDKDIIYIYIIYDIWCNIILYYFKNILLDNEGDGSGKCVRYRATMAAAAYLTRRRLRYSAAPNADRYRRTYKILLTTTTYARQEDWLRHNF